MYVGILKRILHVDSKPSLIAHTLTLDREQAIQAIQAILRSHAHCQGHRRSVTSCRHAVLCWLAVALAVAVAMAVADEGTSSDVRHNTFFESNWNTIHWNWTEFNVTRTNWIQIGLIVS